METSQNSGTNQPESHPKDIGNLVLRVPIIGNVRLSDTVIIASLPVLAYLIVFLYQYGYLEYFGLPTAFIQFNLITVFHIIAVLLFLAFTFYIYGDMFGHMTGLFPEPIKARITRLALSSLCFYYFYYFFLKSSFPKSWKDWSVFLFAISLYVFLEFAIPLLGKNPKKLSYVERLYAFDEKRKEIRMRQERGDLSEPSLDKLVRILGPNMFFFAVFLFVVFLTGRYTAMTQKVFRVASTTPETVVLQMLDNTYVCVPLNRSTGELEKSFFLIRADEHPEITYRLEEIGPLQIKGIPKTRIAIPTSTPTPTPISSLTPSITYTPNSTSSPGKTITIVKTVTPTPVKP